jgi:uncharacterized membrane protein
MNVNTISGIILFGFVVFFVVHSVRCRIELKKFSHGHKTPIDILNERLAKGELSPEEYTEKKRQILS